MRRNHVLILFEYFETVSRNVLDSEQRNRLPGLPPKTTSHAIGTNLQSSRVGLNIHHPRPRRAFLVSQGIDETGRITDTRRHTYDPITFRMQITPSNHETEQRYPCSYFHPLRSSSTPSTLLYILTPWDTPSSTIHLCPCTRAIVSSLFDDIRYHRNKP